MYSSECSGSANYGMRNPCQIMYSNNAMSYKSMAGSSQGTYSSNRGNYGFEIPCNRNAGAYSLFVAEDFLEKTRPASPFIINANYVMPFVEQAFRETTGMEMPKTIQINLMDEKELAEAHSQFGGQWDPGVQGFAINSTMQIFVKKEFMDKLMLTIGHEIGHLLSKPLDTEVDEEAKAFAFSTAWMDAITSNNIAGLNVSISPNPAKNGIHNKAYEYVLNMINNGTSAFELFKALALKIVKTA